MSVIIRLQNLAWSANALDIRQFFRGLSIPEGGVHIVGGEQGDAFIAFSTDEDARQAMMHDGGKIKEMKIKLLLSSRTEMQKVIETARQQTLSLQTFMQTPNVPAVGAITGSSPLSSSNQFHQKSSSPPEKNDNDSESGKERSSKDRRDRSRSRSRERDRRDRDRGRSDRRRRERSRSRERDRRDRGSRRRRDRSRSRDRTRSRDRDSNRRSSQNERRKNSQDPQDDNPDVVCVGQFPKDKLLQSKKSIDNGIWEVPPKNQMQTMMIAPGILGAGVAAITNDNERNLNFNNAAAAIVASGGTPSLLQPAQFPLNSLNGGLQPPGIGNINLNQLPPNIGLPSIANRNSWPTDQQQQQQQPPPRLTDLRFPRGANFNNPDGQPFVNNFGNNNNTNNYRGNNPRSGPTSLLSKTIQELDVRRNPNAFQSNLNSFDNFGNNTNDRSQITSRNSGNNGSFTSGGGYCIEIRNMPLNASYSDVRHAFQGIFIRKDGIKLINDTHGNRVGIAYVKFNKIEGKEIAMSVPRYVRGSEVEICTLEETIFDKAIDSYNPERDGDRDDSSDTSINNLEQNNRTSSCVMIVDLPSFAKEVDIAKTFSEWKINDLFITTKKDLITGATQYSAYLQFSRTEDAKASLQASLKIGPKPITTISITDDKFLQAKRIFESGDNNLLVDGNTSDCVMIRGLPYQINERDIVDYFSDIGLIPRRINMMINKHNSPFTGCFCEFDTIEDAIRATNKNGIPLGKTVPIIELISRNKMMDLLEQCDFGFVDGMPGYPMGERTRFPLMGANHHGRFGNGGGFGPRGPPPPPPPPGIMGMPPRPPMPMNRPPMDYVEGFGKPGCVLSLENVPFKADINEIIEFFGDFDIKRENVIRRYNEKGMPTGDARVAFSSPSEAQRALRELRHCKVRERTIYLKLA